MVITIANQKGGVGKTTTATALASILTEKGYKTLLIDADQQGNSSDTFQAQIEGNSTLYDVLLDDDRLPLKDAIQSTQNGNIVASDPLLREADVKLSNDVEGLYRMKDAIEDLKGFDYIIIDTAPSMGTILYNCLIASDKVIIPVTADRYALQGLSQLNETIRNIKKRQNPNLKIDGLLLVKYNERTLLTRETRDSLETIAREMDTKVYKSKIRESTKAKEAQALRTSLIRHSKKATTTTDYIDFVNELVKEG